MLVVGGTSSVAGALMGAIVLTAWLELIRPIEAGALGIPGLNGIALLSVGIGLILLLLWRPRGALGAKEPQFLPRHASLVRRSDEVHSGRQGKQGRRGDE